MRPRWTHLSLLSIALAPLAGCFAVDVAPSAAGDTLEPKRPSVIAFIDTGINPYHDAFRTDRALDELMGSGIESTPIRLSPESDYREAYDADTDLWEGLRPRQLYHFEGTRILAISFEETSTPLIIDDLGHGTGVASAALATDPDAIILAIDAPTRYCLPADEVGGEDNEIGCVIHPGVVEAMAWVADQPWIDVVSLSFGPRGNHPAPEMDEFARQSARAVRAGKLVIAARGNEAAPAIIGGTSAPPGVIGVGAVEAASKGHVLIAASLPDVVANWTATVADGFDRSATRSVGGTSYATPTVAGALSRAIGIVRAEWAHHEGILDGALAVSPAEATATPWTFRAALNASAAPPPAATEWRPEPPPTTTDDIELARYVVRQTAPIVRPALQTGWGLVDASTAHEVARRVLADDLDVPPEKEQLAREISAFYDLRRSYWDDG